MSEEHTNHIWHEMKDKEVFQVIHSDKNGITKQEANQRLEHHGPNILPRKKPLTWLQVLAHQFTSPLILVLLVAGFVSLLLKEWVDAGVILTVVVMNTVVGFIQEYKASRALEYLQSFVQPHATVFRGGQEVELLAEEIVPGDVLILRRGDRVVADARLFEIFDMEVNEAALTGESLPVKKTLDSLPAGTVLAERTNMVYAGTNVVMGRGYGVVTETGINTEIGKIAKLVQEIKEEQTPLQIELKSLAKWLAIAVLVITIVLFILGILTGHSLFEMFETSIALAVAAIPEGLAVSVTVVLAIGMQRILKRKALVRRLVAAETLGSVSIICTDKTGTITEGEMRVTTVVPFSGPVSLEDDGYRKNAEEIVTILEIGMICNDATVSESPKTKGIEVRGSATERALMEAGLQAGFSLSMLQKRHPRYAEVPFDSKYKYMVTLNSWGEKGRAMLMKGAPEKILVFCAHLLDDGKEKKLTASHKKMLNDRAQEMSKKGLRLIGVAYKNVLSTTKYIPETLDGFTFVGFFGLRDPLRPEARDQIAAARSAGVHTVVITGDHPNTAAAIGAEAGLVTAKTKIVTGAELDNWSDVELKKRVAGIGVYARVEPSHKIRIVDAWQALGKVVAMTGDGVNDAPALKSADIGIALGSGTDVAKESAGIVLLDNNLSTITAAIEQGRVIFDNIRKSTVYLLFSSFSELLLIGGALLLGLPLPLLATQILWVNLVQDTLPSIALGLEPKEPDVMKLPPRKRTEPVLNRQMLFLIFAVGIMTDIWLFLLFLWYYHTTGDLALARTVAFAGLGITALFYVFSVRSFRRTIFRMNPFSNMWLTGSVALGFAFMFLALLHPFFQRIFEITPLRLFDWVILLIISVANILAIELAKEAFHWWDKRK